MKGGKCLYTCSLRPTGIYGEGHELIKDFYKMGVERGGLIIGGVPDDTEHGRVYAGESKMTVCVVTTALKRRQSACCFISEKARLT